MSRNKSKDTWDKADIIIRGIIGLIAIAVTFFISQSQSHIASIQKDISKNQALSQQLEGLASENSIKRRLSAASIKQFGDLSIEPLVTTLGDPDTQVRETACTTLAEIAEQGYTSEISEYIRGMFSRHDYQLAKGIACLLGKLIAHANSADNFKTLLQELPSQSEVMQFEIANGILFSIADVPGTPTPTSEQVVEILVSMKNFFIDVGLSWTIAASFPSLKSTVEKTVINREYSDQIQHLLYRLDVERDEQYDFVRQQLSSNSHSTLPRYSDMIKSQVHLNKYPEYASQLFSLLPRDQQRLTSSDGNLQASILFGTRLHEPSILLSAAEASMSLSNYTTAKDILLTAFLVSYINDENKYMINTAEKMLNIEKLAEHTEFQVTSKLLRIMEIIAFTARSPERLTWENGMPTYPREYAPGRSSHTTSVDGRMLSQIGNMYVDIGNASHGRALVRLGQALIASKQDIDD